MAVSRHDYRRNLDAILAILNEDGDSLARLSYPRDILINQIKNNPKALEWYLMMTEGEPQGMMPIFSDVKDSATYDLYKKYGIKPIGFARSDLTELQWGYLADIKMTPDTYCEDCARAISRSETNDPNVLCDTCSLNKLSLHDRRVAEHNATHDHKYTPMTIQLWCDDNKNWFARADGKDEPIKIYCPGCKVRVYDKKSCPKCYSKHQDEIMIERIRPPADVKK
jgi:hypothetical protein